MFEVCIIGGGAAGMSAALGAAKKGLKKILLIERNQELGGILQQCIHNGFGLHQFHEELTGPTYAERLKNEVLETQIEVKLATTVIKLTENHEIHYINEKEGYQVIRAKAIIVAAGSVEKTRYHIDIPGKRLAGIMTAGMAQKYINMEGYLVGKRVFILGSGDIGLIMARRMHLEGALVLGVAEIMPYSNGLERNRVQCLEDFQIPLYLNHTVIDVSGKNHLEQITLAKVDEKLNPIKNSETILQVDALLLAVGLIPENKLLEAINCQIHPVTKGVIVDSTYQTSIEGIFACGNGLHVHDLVDDVSLEGFQTGQEAALSIIKESKKTKQISVLSEGDIRYVIPNKINLNHAINKVLLKFRVSRPLKNAQLIIKTESKIIKVMKKDSMHPAQMEKFILRISDFNQVDEKIIFEIKEESLNE